MIIHDKNGSTLLDIPVEDNSYRYRAIRQGDKVYLYYSLTEHVEIPVGSYIEYEGRRYTLWRPEDLTKHGTRNLEYVVTFGGDWELLGVTKYKHLSAIPHRLKFSLTGKPRIFLQLLVDNLNENDSGWTVGTCIEAAEKTLSFSHEYCIEALNRFADEWETEFEFAGKTIHFGKVEYFKDSSLPLAYGKGNGFKTGVGRKVQGDKAPVSILYVQGGERNIDATAYGSRTLLLPKSQELEYEGRRYRTDKDGMYITRADRELPNHNEDSYDASHVYPSRVGTVSAVVEVDPENNLYDIIDDSIPDDLDFSQCRIPGETATIIFQSGTLTGEEFDIEQTQDALTGYVHAERRFKLVPTEKEGGVIPNANRKPAVGDTYAVFNISLPEAYVCDDETRTGASWEMFRESVRYLYENEDERFAFTGELDGIWSKSRWLEVGGYTRPGAYVYFSDPQFLPDGARIRVTGVKDYINRPYSPELELSNTPVAGFVSSDLGKIDSNEVKEEERYREMLHYTRRRWRDAIEAQGMLEAAFSDYSKGIDPIWVRTMSLLVGDESLQFRFVDSKTAPRVVEPDFIYDQETGVFTAPAAILQHMTLGIADIKGEHKASEYKFWDMATYVSPPLGDFGKLYLYARCPKAGTAGAFLLSEEPHAMEEGSDYYFLVGLLGSQYDGTRSFATVYGFTEILPGRITVDRIVSTDGNTYFNLALGEIGGNIRIKAGSSGYNNLSDKPDLGIYATTAELDVLDDRITGTVTAFDEFQREVMSAGWITQADGNTWWASKSLEDGDEIVSYINQTATSIKIKAERVDLVGAVTFSMFDTSLKSTINGKASVTDVNNALRNYVTTASLNDRLGDYALASALSGYVTSTALSNRLRDYATTTAAGELATSKAEAEFDKLANALVSGTTSVIGGFISADILDIDTIFANALYIGNFEINSYKGLTWRGADYFGGTEFSLALGTSKMGVSTDMGAIISASSSSARNHCCVAAVCNSFGVAIYGSTDGWGSNFPTWNAKFAGFFSGSVRVTGGVQAGAVASPSFRYAVSFGQDQSYTYMEGIDVDPADYDLDDIRFRIRGGIIVGVTDDSGNVLRGL